MLYSNDRLYIVGLTGMSGAGKSTACRVFSEKGFFVIDCDMTAREVTEKGAAALGMIAERFGSVALNSDGTFNRRAVGDIVFADRKELDALQDIIFPFIIYRLITVMKNSGCEKVLLDAPTLFESAAYKLCDAVVSVTADISVCAERIKARDGLTYEQAIDRLSSQRPESFYAERSDYNISNNGTQAELIRKAADIADKLGDISYR